MIAYFVDFIALASGLNAACTILFTNHIPRGSKQAYTGAVQDRQALVELVRECSDTMT